MHQCISENRRKYECNNAPGKLEVIVQETLCEENMSECTNAPGKIEENMNAPMHQEKSKKVRMHQCTRKQKSLRKAECTNAPGKIEENQNAPIHQ